MYWVSIASRDDLILEDLCGLIVQPVSPLVDDSEVPRLPRFAVPLREEGTHGRLDEIRAILKRVGLVIDSRK